LNNLCVIYEETREDHLAYMSNAKLNPKS